MGRDLFFDASGGLIVFQQLPEALTAHTGSVNINKQGDFIDIRYHAAANGFYVYLERI